MYVNVIYVEYNVIPAINERNSNKREVGSIERVSVCVLWIFSMCFNVFDSISLFVVPLYSDCHEWRILIKKSRC